MAFSSEVDTGSHSNQACADCVDLSAVENASKQKALATREAGKFLHHALIHRPLERHDQVREVLHRLPAPVHEWGLVAAAGAGDVNLAIIAGEANREPFLALAAIAALPGAAGDRARNVVDQPVGDFAELLHRSNAGFFVKLAFGRGPGVLAGVDATLRHLPDMGFIDMLDSAGAATDEDQPRCVDQHHADACSVGQVFVARHAVKTLAYSQSARPSDPAGPKSRRQIDLQSLGPEALIFVLTRFLDASRFPPRSKTLYPDFDFNIAVVNGTSMMPRLSRVLIQAPIRSIEIGNAEPTPTATPRSLASVSSLISVRSISADVGTASMARSALPKGIAWLAANERATLRGVAPSSR